MYQFKSNESIASKVRTVVKSHVETRGVNWILTLTYGECNDYAASVASLLQCRFETAARNIRAYKQVLRRSQPSN